MFDKHALLVSRRGLCLHAETIGPVEIDPQSLAVEGVLVAVASEGVAEQFPRLAHRLVEACRAPPGVVAGP
jgi:hypothetical protein